MYLNSIFIIFLIITCTVVNCQLQDKPNILNVEVSADAKIIITWNISNELNYKLTRYRLQYSIVNGDTQSLYQDWPAQLRRSSYNTHDAAYAILDTKSNFECYNECLKDPNCGFVVRQYAAKQNCYLKSNFNSSNQYFIEDANVAQIIGNVSNPIVVQIDNFIMDFQAYKFRVSFFDQYLKNWTHFSDDSEKIDLRVGLEVSIRQLTRSNLLMKWNKISIYPSENVISRLSVKVEEDYSGVYRIYDIQSGNLLPSASTYFDINSDDVLLLSNVVDISTCNYFCISLEKCVFYAYLQDDDQVYSYRQGTCFIKTKLNTTNGVSLPTSYSKFHVINSNSEWVYVHKMQSANYTFQLNSITPFGQELNTSSIKYQTNILPLTYTISYNRSDLTVTVNLNLNNMPKSARYLINYTIDDQKNTYYYYEKSTYYNDTDNFDGKGETFNDCYERCVFNEKCLAIRWGQYPYYCTFISKIDKPIPCSNSASCLTIPDFSNEIKFRVWPTANKYCINLLVRLNEVDLTYLSNENNCIDLIPFKLEIKTETTEFIEGERAQLYCTHNNISLDLIKQIEWFYNYTKLESGLEYYIEISDDNTTLTFNHLNHSINNGNYNCKIILMDDVTITSNNSISITISYPISLQVPEKLEYKAGDDAEIPCLFYGYPTPQLAWKAKDSNYDINTTTLTGNVFMLHLKNLTRDQSGVYQCYVKTNTSISKNIDLIVQSKPSAPIIERLKNTDNDFYLKWKIDDNGLNEIINLIIEISRNFNDFSIALLTLSISYNEIKNDEYNFSVIVEDGSYLRIKAENILGISEPSDSVKIQRVLTNTNQSNDSEKYFIPFLISCCVVIIAIAGAVYFVFFHRRVFKRKRAGSTIIHEDHEEIMNYIPKFYVSERPPEPKIS